MNIPHMKYARLLLTVTFFATLLHTTETWAQQLQATLSHYSTDEGLPSNAVADIKQDSYGYVWIATWNGLSRFDGFVFHNYTTGVGSRLPHMHNRIIDLTLDMEQNVWLRMYDGRVFVLNRKTDCIENPLEGQMDNRYITTDSPLCLAADGCMLVFINGKGLLRIHPKDKGGKVELVPIDKTGTRMLKGTDGTIWIGTRNGLLKLSGKQYEKISTISEKGIRSLCTKGKTIFVGTFDGSIIAYDYKGNQCGRWDITTEPVSSLFADSHGDLWFATNDRGIKRINLTNGAVSTYSQEVVIPQDDALGALICEVNATLWVRMYRGGFGYYNRKRDCVEYFYNTPSAPWALSNTVGCFLVSPEGIVWETTTRQGLERLELIKPTIKHIKPFEPQEERYANSIRAIYYDAKNRLLFVGSKNNMLQITNEKGQKTLLNTDGNGEAIGRIYGISQDREGNYWISCKEGGLLKMSRKGGGYAFSRFKHSPADPQSISSPKAYCSVEDDNGNIWVGTYDGGVNILVKQRNGKTVFLNTNNVMRHYPKGAYMKVRTLAKDKEGNIWVGTTDGLLVMSYKNGVIRTERASEMSATANGLLCTDIVCLACADNGTIWIGTNGGGLSRCIGRGADGKWAFETLTSKADIPSEEVKSITFDNRGNVWFATDHNLCSYDIRKHIISCYGVQDGVDDTMFSEGCAITLTDGTLLFGTINGYYIVDRKLLGNQAGSKLRLRVTDLYLDGELLEANAEKGIGYYVPDSMVVELPRHGASFAFRFAALNHKLQKRTHYQYMLEGFDKDWRNADNTRMAAYDDLPAGTYTLRIKAFLMESPESYDMCTVKITVPPHFLLSAKALWIYIVLAVAMAIFLLHLRRKRLARIAQMRVLKIGPQEIAFTQKKDYDFVKKQLDWLEANYSNSSLRIEDLAAMSKMSRTSYYNELKSLTGLSPKELVSDFRLKKARMLLEKTDTTVAEIAYKTGFNDPVYFTRLFRTTFGQTPTQYRKERNESGA
jgi:ligand-binding sensor domain-containing protein/AraC-like DNA-binding protein